MYIVDEVQSLIKGPEYSFLREDDTLSGRLVFLCLGGSHAYGTNVDTSDIDIRGITLNRKSDLLGFSEFDQYTSKTTDTSIYSFNKFIKLCLACNPNIIEMLGCRSDHYFEMTQIGRTMIDNVSMFLSKRAVDSFGGYATAQLRRLENAVGRDTIESNIKEKHILGSIHKGWNGVGGIAERHEIPNSNNMEFFFDEDGKLCFKYSNIDSPFIDVFDSVRFCAALSEVNAISANYDKLQKRNRKKTLQGLDKHAMHLVRLYLMCFDILEKGVVKTYRDSEHDFLMSIRNGRYRNDDGTYKPEFFELIDGYENRLKYAAKNTDLPDQPDYKKAEEFVMYVNEVVVRRG